MSDAADQFVDLACLTYLDDESRTRRQEAAALLAATPGLVDAGIHAAAAAGDVAALRAHLDRSPPCIEQRGTPRQWVPLLSLCYSRVEQLDSLACVDLLLARGADPNAHVMLYENRFTALTGVMGEGESGPFEQPPHPHARAIAERLLDAGANPNETQGLYNTHFLPGNEWLGLLLARGLSSTWDREYLLGQAAVQGFRERVQLLLAHGTNVDGSNHYNKRTHVENALLEGHADIARMLLDAGARPPAFTANERFRAAVLANDAAGAREILAASPSAITEPAALFAAARHGRLDALELGLALGLPIDGCDEQGLTPLHHAARTGHVEIVRKLVQAGASLEIRDALYNATPRGHAQHFAERWSRPDIAAIVAILDR